MPCLTPFPLRTLNYVQHLDLPRRWPVRRSDSTWSFLEPRRRDVQSNLAHVHEQAEFRIGMLLRVAGHLYQELTRQLQTTKLEVDA